MTYSTWEYYSQVYKGDLDECVYSRLAVRAKGLIDYYTMGRAAYAEECMGDNLALAECTIIDKLNSFNSLSEMGGITGVSSVNNDGYSVSFSSTSSADQKNEIKEILSGLLTTPCNLMSAAVRVRNVQRPPSCRRWWPEW